MRRIFLTCTLLALFPPVQALTLQQAYQRALNHDPDVAMAHAQWQAQQAVERASKGALYPQINFSAVLGRLDTTRTSTQSGADFRYDSDTRNWNLSLRQTLYRADMWHDWKHQQALSESHYWRVPAQKRNLFVEVGRRYSALVAAQTRLQAAIDFRNETAAQLKALQRRYALGQADRAEVAQVSAQLSHAQAQVDQYTDQLHQARLQLALFVGIPLDKTPLNTTLDTLVRQADQLIAQGIAALMQQLDTHPLIRSARAEINAAHAAIARAFAGHKPQVELSISRSMSDSDSVNTLGYEYNTTSAQIRLNLPLYSGGSTTAQVEAARQRLAAAQAQLASQQRTLKAQLIQYATDLSGALKQLQGLNGQRSAALTQLAAAERRHRLGQGDLSAIIQVRQHLAQLEIERITLQERIASNWLQLSSLLGLPDNQQ